MSGNSAIYAGGIGATSNSTVTVINSTVSGNSASEYPGGILASSSTVSLINTTVNGNSAGESGGGLHLGYSTVTLTNSTVSGNSAGAGGGLVMLANSTVTLTHSTVSGNSATYGAGGLVIGWATVTLTNSTVSNNAGGGQGGGLSLSGSIVTLTNSTVSRNSSEFHGGGLYADGGSTVTLANSTVSANSAALNGGGLGTGWATVTLANSTVTGNSADAGGGLYVDELWGRSTVTLQNTIVAAQVSGADCVIGKGSVASAGDNLDSDGTCGLTGPGDQPGTDPLLGPLQDNGGPTWTHALLPGSPAIDAIPVGTNGCGDAGQTDQRGVARPQGAGCDIGAYEVQAEAPLGVNGLLKIRGLPAPGVTATLINTQTNQKVATTTDPGGDFAFDSAPPGTYSLRLSPVRLARVGYIAGQLRIGEDPVAGATVQLWLRGATHPLETSTQPDGIFVFRGVRKGVYEIRVPTFDVP